MNDFNVPFIPVVLFNPSQHVRSGSESKVSVAERSGAAHRCRARRTTPAQKISDY